MSSITGEIKDSFKNLINNQPTEFEGPTWVQRLQSRWDQDLTSTQRKVLKVAIPILVVGVAIGLAALGAYIAPAGYQKMIGSAILLNVGAATMGGYQLCLWRWGKSYSERMMNVEEEKPNPLDPKKPIKTKEITEERIQCFKDNSKFFRDFDSKHLTCVPGKEKEFLAGINTLLENCPQARSVTLNRHFDAKILNTVAKMKHVKKLTLDFSDEVKAPRTEKEILDLFEHLSIKSLENKSSLKHINLVMPDDGKVVAGEKPPPKPVKFTSECINQLVNSCPNLKTLQISHMKNDAWVHFSRLSHLKEVTATVKSLKNITEEDAKAMNVMKDAVWKNCKKFKHFKIIHPQWDPRAAPHTRLDIFRPEAKTHLENKGISIDYQEDPKEEKVTLTLEYRMEKKDFVRKFRSMKKTFLGAFSSQPVHKHPSKKKTRTAAVILPQS